MLIQFPEPPRKAFLDYLIDIAHSEKGSFTEQELREEVDTFIVAVRSCILLLFSFSNTSLSKCIF